MTIDPRDAAASLGEIAKIEHRTREAINYDTGSVLLIVWGVVWVIGHTLAFLTPRNTALTWYVLDALGVAAAVGSSLLRPRRRRLHWDWRLTAAFIVLMAFGFFWEWLLGGRQWREITVFWSTLFMFGYILAGLWLGRFFIFCGAAVTLLVLAGYFWSGPWFELWIAASAGGGLILGGLWLRRLGAEA
jgi:hypothetical protein